MAKTRTQLYYDYLSAKNKANELDEIANEIIKLSNEHLSNEFMLSIFIGQVKLQNLFKIKEKF